MPVRPTSRRASPEHGPGWRVTSRLAGIATLIALTGALAAPAAAVTYGTSVASPSQSVPWVLSLYRADHAGDQASFTCTATALSSRQVLTAAHCVTDVTERPFYFVKVGADRLTGGTLVPVEAVVVDRRYTNARTTHDIALLRPLTPLRLRSYARLGTPGQARAINGTKPPSLTMYGWGENQNERLTNQLGSARLESSRQAAARAYGGEFKPSVMVAAAHFNTASRTYSGGCHGDSGGPLVVRSAGTSYVVGVTSFGAGCRARIPTVFTSVGAYRPWITSAKTALPRVAVTDNRALPVNLRQPVVTGTPAVGATLSCGPGSWSANTNSTVTTWSVGPTQVATGPALVVPSTFAGSTLTCTVTARSDAGRITKAAPAVAVPQPVPPPPPPPGAPA